MKTPDRLRSTIGAKIWVVSDSDIRAIQSDARAELEAENKALRIDVARRAGAGLDRALEFQDLEKENKALNSQVEALRKTSGLKYSRTVEAEAHHLMVENRALRDRMRAMEEILDVWVGHTCVADGKGNFIGAENCPAHRWEELKANSSNFTLAT